MGKTYYCEYCDRSFKDAKDARKKHLTSLQHIITRENYYRTYTDPETVLQQESMKIPCKRMAMYGDCAFGNGCKFTHYTPIMLEQLKQAAAMKEKKKVYAPNPDDIKKEFFEDLDDTEEIEEIDMTIWKQQPHLLNQADLPPSMWPINPNNVGECMLPDWGDRNYFK